MWKRQKQAVPISEVKRTDLFGRVTRFSLEAMYLPLTNLRTYIGIQLDRPFVP